MAQKTIPEIIKSAMDAYSHCADVVIVGSGVEIINRITKCNHMFVNGKERLELSNAQLIDTKKRIEEFYKKRNL